LGATLLWDSAGFLPGFVVDEDQLEAPEDGGRVVELGQGGEQALHEWVVVYV